MHDDLTARASVKAHIGRLAARHVRRPLEWLQFATPVNHSVDQPQIAL